MRDIKGLKITVVSSDGFACRKLQELFSKHPEIEVCHTDIRRYCYENRGEFDCLVSPANAFGFMTGGYDAALSDILGWDFQKKVQAYIQEHFYGEQGVGTSFMIGTNIPGVSLIHTPTMRYPSSIIDDWIVYYCMRSTLICALENDVKHIIVPVFGSACGGVEPEVAAWRMLDAYEQILTKQGASEWF